MKKRQLHIFTVGGTIDKVYFDALSEYQVGEPSIKAILGKLPLSIDYQVESLFRKDSLELTDDDRAVLRQAIEASSEEAIVVTHGTDTMSDTAEFLMPIKGKTIVLTGALQPAGFLESDAMFNIGGALTAAQSLPHGVYIVMNGCVFDAGHVKKNRSAGRFEGH